MELLIAAENGIYSLIKENDNYKINDVSYDPKHRHFALLNIDNLIYYTKMDAGYKTNGDVNPKGYISAINKDTKEIIYSSQTDNPDIHHMILWNDEIVTLSVTGDLIFYSKDLSKKRYITCLNDLVPKHLSHPPLIVNRGPVGLRNIYHFNYSFIYNDILYAMAHNIKNPSFILKYNLLSKEVSTIELDGAMYHDCMVFENKILINDSLRSVFRILDMDGTELDRVQLEGFLRGISVNDNFIIIGSSWNKETKEGSKAQLFFIDKNSYRVIDAIDFEDAHQIYDILEV